MIAPEVRATIAAVVLAHAKDRLVTTLYDYTAGDYRNIRASFKGDTVDAYDSGRVAKMTGALPDLFDHVLGQYIHLKPEGERYNGFDHYSGTHFHLMINGNTASLYDHDAEVWSQYSL